jgi:hypothetical protein
MIIIIRYGARPGWRGLGSWELGVGSGMVHIRWLWIGYGHITNVTHSICIGRLLSSMNSILRRFLFM